MKRFISGRHLSEFGIASGHLAGVELSGLVPALCRPCAGLVPALCRPCAGLVPALCRPCAGRGLNPRPERSTHAKAGKQRTEKGINEKIHFGETSFRIWNCERTFGGGGAFRSGVQPPTGSRETDIPRPTPAPAVIAAMSLQKDHPTITNQQRRNRRVKRGHNRRLRRHRHRRKQRVPVVGDCVGELRRKRNRPAQIQ